MAETAILVVDDDAPIRRMLDRTLAAEGYAVESAADGGEALAAVERSAPDLIVLDVSMPGLDGLAVCRRLRAKGLATPVLLLTARDEVPDRVAGLDAGADDYLVKPFATDELLARDPRAAAPARARGAARARRSDLRSGDAVGAARRRRGRSSRRARRTCSSCSCATRGASCRESRRSPQIWQGATRANTVDRDVTNLRRKLGEPP